MIDAELKRIAALVDGEIRASLAGAGGGSDLYRAALHLPMQGGKRMRPFLVIKSCEAVGGRAEDALSAAAAIEVLHNFTLVHDDIMDNDLLRRGAPTVHTLWGVPTAILAGDLLFAKAFSLILSSGAECARVRRSAEVLARATVTLSEGQRMDMSFEDREEVTEEEYFEMVYRKTGALIEASATIGGIIGGGGEAEIGALAEYGASTGTAFQIYDDYLGISSRGEVLGKLVGNDIRAGKKTLIVIKALQTPARGGVLRLLGKRDASDSEISSLVRALEENGVLDYVRAKASSLTERALGALSRLRPSPARKALEELALYTISREK